MTSGVRWNDEIKGLSTMYSYGLSDADNYAELLREAYEENRHPGWAYHQYVDRNGGHEPKQKWAAHACLGKNPKRSEIKKFINYLIGHYTYGDTKQKVWFHLRLELGEKFDRYDSSFRQGVYLYIEQECSKIKWC
ncbi:hypothetical protein [Acaryochloris sp. IP29b_bin.148]|uniref:hypothetical protein n=1 Tax=Acaryochloris sp. IP29b_bin.148 TaxID=2969218 RepID=UPI00262CE75F|nr:hypothetical protein [Acaryochloris sp. IP29b_bin.148]